MLKLAVITTHPIQYYAPLFKLIAESKHIQLKVFYTWGEDSIKPKYDPGFAKAIQWDLPLLEGYDYTFVKNTAAKPGSHHFKGIINPTLIQDIKEWQAKALLVFGWSYRSHLKVIRYFKGKIPIFFRGDSHLLNERSGIKQILRRISLKWIYRHIDYAFYVGARNKQYYLKHGLKEEQLLFAPHAVDNQRFYDIDGQYSQKAAEWRQQLGIDDEKIIVLFAGKFEHTKSPLLLLQAAKQLQTYSKLVFLFVGNGKLEKQMKKDAKGTKNVYFKDFQNQSQMPVLYRLADIFILPSRGETWGLAVNEAMACDRPVLVSDRVGCAIDLVEQGINGHIFQAKNLSNMKEKLLAMCNSKGNLDEMGQNSARLIKNWNISHTAQAMSKQLLKTIL